MFRLNNKFSIFIIIICCIYLLSDYGMCQLDPVWCLETPAGENHRFRDIAVNKSQKRLYISDTYTDVIYIYDSENPSIPIGSFGNPSWRGWPGPYGISIAEDQKIYIAVMCIEDENNNRIDDYSIWQCSSNGNNLRRVCTLPSFSRGIKVINRGINTTIYVSGNNGNIIRCIPDKNPHSFRAEILFNVNVSNQQDILITEDEEILYTSYWSAYAPFGSTVVKWNHLNGNWTLDTNFNIMNPLRGNFPGIDFSYDQNQLYVFQIGIYGNSSHIYKIDPITGSEVSSVWVAPSAILSDGSSGAGGLDIVKKGNIYFAGSFGMKNNYNYSIYGMIHDTNHQDSTEHPITTQIDHLRDKFGTKTIYLSQNFPNPFNPSTNIKFTLPTSSKVKIEILNLLGQNITTLVNKQMLVGSHEVEFTANNLPGGIYLYRIEAGDPSTGSGQGFQEVRKMILLK